ncbi:MAG: hypothetical protein HZC25_17505 [Rhodospirillales bacterium]|nr:hypothetical protein [Rhodospirillales bacterium]
MAETITIAPRFNGPRQSGNGGYVGGLLAGLAGRTVAVTFRKPSPLATPLAVVESPDAKLALMDGDSLIAEAQPFVLALDVPKAPDPKTCEAISATGGCGEGSPFAWCFGCGRFHPDGLHVMSGPVPGPEKMAAAAWRPRYDLGDARSFLPKPFLWAALDCIGAIALRKDDRQAAFLTGRMAAKVDDSVLADRLYRVIAWVTGAEGRKRFTGAALIDEKERVRGLAFTTWIEVDPAKVPT